MACVYRFPQFFQSAVALVPSHAMLRDMHLSMMQVQMGSNKDMIFHCMRLATQILQRVWMTFRLCFNVVTCVPGCIRKATSDLTRYFCVPAGVTGIPPLSSATIVKNKSCLKQGSFPPPGCKAAQTAYEAGTGCLDKCQAEFAVKQKRTQDFCKGLDAWKCDGTPAPCSGALPAGSATAAQTAGAVCGTLVV
jgi:hypothetical protein